MLEEFGSKNGGRSSGQVKGRGQQKGGSQRQGLPLEWRCVGRNKNIGQEGLNGWARSTEMKYMRRYKGKCDIFFGIEHRLRTAEMEEQFIKEAKEGWSFAANAARITDETTGSEDR